MKQDNKDRIARICRYRLCLNRKFRDITGRKFKSAYRVCYFNDDNELDLVFSFLIYLEELQENQNEDHTRINR